MGSLMFLTVFMASGLFAHARGHGHGHGHGGGGGHTGGGGGHGGHGGEGHSGGEGGGAAHSGVAIHGRNQDNDKEDRSKNKSHKEPSLETKLLKFKDTYKGLNDEPMKIEGYEPNETLLVGGNASGPGGLPVFIWIMGGFDSFGAEVDQTWIKAMAFRGFISGAIDYVSFNDRFVWDFRWGGANKQYEDLAAKATRLPYAISKLCARPRADCSNGVAVAGHSQGGFITIFSVKHDSRITAVLAMGVGCLGKDLASGLLDEEVTKYLPRTKRLYISGEADAQIDPKCMKRMNWALHPDGSGYVMIPEGPHQFYSVCDPTLQGSTMKCAYSKSLEGWGFNQALNWLALAASPSKADLRERDYNYTCDIQTIAETPDCGGRPVILVALLTSAIIGACVACCVCCCNSPNKTRSLEVYQDNDFSSDDMDTEEEDSAE